MSRSFREIVVAAGADAEVAEAVKARPHQPRDWRLRNSIPSEFWSAFAAQGFASLDELAKAAEARASERSVA